MILPFVRDMLSEAEKAPAFKAGVHAIHQGRAYLSGLTPTAKALYLPYFARALDAPLLVIVADNKAADALLPLLRSTCDLIGAVSPDAVLKISAYDVLPFENLSPHPDIQEERAVALWKLSTGQARILIAPIESAAMRLRSPDFYHGLARIVRRGEELDLESLIERLHLIGYAPSDVVDMPGQYARRGSILDVYPPEADRPFRIDFFGDEVESIRRFDPQSQRTQPSGAQIDEAVLLPFTETPVDELTLAAIHRRLSGKRLEGSPEELNNAISVGGVTVFPGWELYAAVAYSDASHSLCDLLPHAYVFVDEPSAVGVKLQSWWQKILDAHERSGVGSLVKPDELYVAPTDWQSAIQQRPGAALEQLSLEPRAISFGAQPTLRFHGSIPAMVEEIQRLTREARHTLFAAPNQGEVERLAEVFHEYRLPFRIGSRAQTTSTGESYLDEAALLGTGETATIIVRTNILEGVTLPESNLVLFGMRDLFDDSEMVAQRPLRQKSKTSAFLSDFRDLAVGDYVVHVEHGIAQYQGLKEITTAEQSGEYMVLEFAENAKYYVPLTRLDLIQKYRSTDTGVKPALSRLGGQQWAKTKARVKKRMIDMADELLKLYAQRKLAQGHAYALDSQWQKEFEDSFDYNETDDQISAIADIKADMESQQPMDRLLCGDVGYGKTEVAMRAAMKAVQDSKQVVVLAPTTVLAFQHFETFKRRFAAFPINIEMLSRFRTTKQQKQSIERLANGKVDIVIGTHRILSKDLVFPDLGLVIVDEEQRFGVTHKERLKKMRTQVDVLTMSATPIPRTLHMSMVGVRDMSLIETPPRDRMAIQTVVAKFDEKLIKSAIETELERGGQIYFVHNRVESIYEIAAKLRELVPAARIIIGHGQMSEGELEKVMLAFMRHDFDVLVATTIIENGLDIPLCNTILINRADRHGLSELYQLRGRVGRSSRRAYAYLLVPPDMELSPVARRRLAALKEFSDLGAGFKIAALDLELRGAGNLLGGEQSGEIEAIGFEMYTTMLEQTVRQLQGGNLEEERPAAQLNLALNLRIPNTYIQEENQRLRMYKRIAAADSVAMLNDVRAELLDRYGPAPAPIRHLLMATELKINAISVGVASIDRRLNSVSIKFSGHANIDPGKLMQFVAANKGAQFSPSGLLKFTLRASSAEEILQTLLDLLSQFAPETEQVA
ncbi:MAG: transcription-repair coupling factor [Acidobacteriaceae bacterium]